MRFPSVCTFVFVALKGREKKECRILRIPPNPCYQTVISKCQFVEQTTEYIPAVNAQKLVFLLVFCSQCLESCFFTSAHRNSERYLGYATFTCIYTAKAARSLDIIHRGRLRHLCISLSSACLYLLLRPPIRHKRNFIDSTTTQRYNSTWDSNFMFTSQQGICQKARSASERWKQRLKLQCRRKIGKDLRENTELSVIIYQGLHHSPSTRIRRQTEITEKHYTVHGFKERGGFLAQFWSIHIGQNGSVSYVKSWRHRRVGPDQVELLTYVP